MILLSREMFIALTAVICVVYIAINGFITANIIRVYGLGLGKAFQGKGKDNSPSQGETGSGGKPRSQ